jgi:hypothetical protein
MIAMNPHLPFEEDTDADRPSHPVDPIGAGGAPSHDEPGALPWGVVGSNRYQRLKPGPGRGIVRTEAGRGVVYHKPPLPSGALAWVPDGEDQWQMALNLSSSPHEATTLKELGVRSLVEFSRELRVLHRLTNRAADDEARCQQLRQEVDLIAEQLLDLVTHLHGSACSIGLLNPESILILGEGPALRLILPDLGFVRTGEPRGRPPVWLRPDDEFQLRWGPLWEGRDPTLQQGKSDSGQPDRAPEGVTTAAARSLLTQIGFHTQEVADLKQIARIFAWVLNGQAESDIPTRDEDPSTAAPVWYVLDCVVRGQLGSAREFRERVRQHPLSQHFLPPDQLPRVAPDLGSSGWGRLLALYSVGLAAIAATVFWAAIYTHPSPDLGGPYPDPRQQPEKALPADSPLRELVQQFQQAKDLDERFQVLMHCYAVSKLSWSEKDRKLEEHWRDYLRGQFQEQMRARLVLIPREAEEEPGALNDRVLEVKTLMGYLNQLPQTSVHPSLIDQEKQCLEQCQLWLERWGVSA